MVLKVTLKDTEECRRHFESKVHLLGLLEQHKMMVRLNWTESQFSTWH